jgi:hypothetical protein
LWRVARLLPSVARSLTQALELIHGLLLPELLLYRLLLLAVGQEREYLVMVLVEVWAIKTTTR